MAQMGFSASNAKILKDALDQSECVVAVRSAASKEADKQVVECGNDIAVGAIRLREDKVDDSDVRIPILASERNAQRRKALQTTSSRQCSTSTQSAAKPQEVGPNISLPQGNDEDDTHADLELLFLAGMDKYFDQLLQQSEAMETVAKQRHHELISGIHIS